MNAITRCLVPLVLTAAALPAMAEVAAADRIAVTDARALAALGYPPDAQGIHRHRLVASPPSPPATAQTGIQGITPGIGYTTVTGFDFHPSADTVEYAKGPSFLVLNGGLTSLTAGAVFESQLHMAQNAWLRYLDVFGTHDTAGRTLGASLVERCLPFLTGGNATETVLATMSVPDQDGLFVVSPPIPANTVVDNRLCTYHARLRFGDAAAAAPGITMQVAKVRIEWRQDSLFADDFELP